MKSLGVRDNLRENVFPEFILYTKQPYFNYKINNYYTLQVQVINECKKNLHFWKEIFTAHSF